MRKDLLNVKVVGALRSVVRHTEVCGGGMCLKLRSLLRGIQVLTLNFGIPLLYVVASTATPACSCITLVTLLADAVRVSTRLAS